MYNDEELDKLIEEVEEERKQLEGENHADDDDSEGQSTSSSDNTDGNEGDTGSGDDSEGEDDSEEDSGEDEGVDDGDDGDDDSDDSDSESDNSSVSGSAGFTPIKVNFHGQEIQLDSQEEVQKYINRTQAMAQSAGTSNADNMLKQAGVDTETFKLMVDAKNGDKAAIAKLIVDSKMDTEDFDLNLADEYTNKWEYDEPSDVDVVATRILADEALASKVKGAFTKVPDDFSNMVTTNAAMLNDFSEHVRNGLADKIIPLAQKEYALNGGDFATLYTTIGE